MSNAVTHSASNGMTIVLSAKTDARIVAAHRRGSLVIVRCSDKAAAAGLRGELGAMGIRGINHAHGTPSWLQFSTVGN